MALQARIYIHPDSAGNPAACDRVYEQARVIVRIERQKQIATWAEVELYHQSGEWGGEWGATSHRPATKWVALFTKSSFSCYNICLRFPDFPKEERTEVRI